MRKLVVWTTLLAVFSTQIAVAAPPPPAITIPPTSELREAQKKNAKPEIRKILDNYKSTFIVDPENYPELTDDAYKKFFDDARSGKIESVEIIYNLNEYYNTKANLENGIAYVEGGAGNKELSTPKHSSGVNCEIVHEDTGQPCKEFFAVIYRQPGFPAVNLLEGFTREKRAEVEAENDARRQRNSARGAKVGDENYEKLKLVPPVQYGMTWWDYVYSLDKLKTDNEKIMFEKWGYASEDVQWMATAVTAVGTLLLAYAVRGDKGLSNTNQMQQALNGLDKGLNKISKSIYKTARKVVKKEFEKTGVAASSDELKSVWTAAVVEKIGEVKLSPVAADAAKKAQKGPKRWYQYPASTVRMAAGGANYFRKNIPFISGAARSWTDFVRDHWIFGSLMHYGLVEQITKFEMKALELKYKPEINARMYLHGLVTTAFADATRRKGAASMITGTPNSGFMPADKLGMAATEDASSLMEDELQERVEKRLNEVKEPAKATMNAAQAATQVAGPDMGKALAEATPGDNVTNAPEPIRLTPTDKPLYSARAALLEFLTKYNKKAVRVEATP